VNGFTTRFHLYTVPGQVYYRLSRRAVLQGLDGIVFVADSHPAREDANRDSLADLGMHLVTLGLPPEQLRRLPWVFQYNKRDVMAAVSVERLRAALNPGGAPEFETVAIEGKGVAETLRAICKAVLARLASEPARASGEADLGIGGGTGAAPGVSAMSAAGVGAGMGPRHGGPVPAQPGPGPGVAGPAARVTPGA